MANRMKELIHEWAESERCRKIRSLLPPLNFITVHYAYFILTCMICSVVFWATSTPGKSISYTDSLFLVVSAMTESGLNTVNLSTLTTFQQILLWILIVIGSSIFVSISTVLTRKRVFESRFRDVVKLQKEARRSRRRSISVTDVHDAAAEPRTTEDDSKTLSSNDPAASPNNVAIPISEMDKVNAENISNNALLDESISNDQHHSPGDGADHISFMHYAPSPTLKKRRVLSFAGVGAHPSATGYKAPHSDRIHNRTEGKEPEKSTDTENIHHWQYPTYLNDYTIGRNGQFFGLSKAQREHLGGVEYRAITLLAWIVTIYFVLWQLLGCVALGAYVAHYYPSTAEENGMNPWWLGIFNAVSAFNNSGMSLLDQNMSLIPFQKSSYMLVSMGLFILAGNTAYPLFLRLILWTMFKLICLIYPSPDQHADHKATLRFILTYPRRVYTNLFPSAPTWWLFFMLIVLNGIDWAAFELLNIGNSFTGAIPTRFRVLDGLFQALAVRSGGFYIIAIPSLRIGLQVLYVIMMYISVYPVVITMRHSNVYEERSLGIYADEGESDEEALPPRLGTVVGKLQRTITKTFSHPLPSASGLQKNTGTEFVRQQIRGQLAHDIWWLVLATLLISCIEVGNFERDPVTYSVFNIIFEVVSGYGCVGISTGLPNEAYSFSGGWHICSKLILCAVMLRGRHRGLPVALDRAVRLPGGELGVMEEEDQIVRRRSMSRSRTALSSHSARSPLADLGGEPPHGAGFSTKYT